MSIGAEPMKYGLDLRGGVHFLMEVDTEKTISDRIEGLEQDVKRALRDKSDRIRYTSLESPARGVLKVSFSEEALRDRARDKIES